MNSSREGGPRPPSHSSQPPTISPLTPATAASEPPAPENSNTAPASLEKHDSAQPASQPDPNPPATTLNGGQVESLVPTADEAKRAATPAQADSQQDPSQASQAAPVALTPTTMAQDLAFANTAMDLFSHQAMAPMPDLSLLMTLTNMSANQARLPMLTSISPAQMSLSRASRIPGDLLPIPDDGHPADAAPAPLESFARIEFADSEFQMTTYAVIIGRDQRALNQARREVKRKLDWERQVEEHVAQGLPPPSPPAPQQPRFSRSWYSEEGGMLGPESDGEDGHRPAKRRKTSGNGSGSANSQQNPVEQAPAVEEMAQDMIVNRQYVSHTPGAAAVDLASLRPSPYDVPFIGIHSPGKDSAEIANNTKGISREHLKIEFNQDLGVFEAIPLHKNGFFCQDVHYKETKVVLRSGDHLQIKDVYFVFYINGVAEGKTGAEEYADEDARRRRYSEGGKEMSFEFESSHAGEIQSTSEDEAQAAAEVPEEESQSELSDVPEDDMDLDENDDSAVMETIEKDAEENGEDIKREPEPESQQPQIPMLPPKKRGPGRPPKNGIMSKREERLMKKAQMELAKKTLPQPPPGEPPIKRKVGRPRKHPLPENAGDQPEKRKYKPRKPKGEDGAEGEEGERSIKEKRREKPKTPPLELDRSNYTEDQLQKPNKNYGVLIDEVLTAAPDGLTLKQIYKRIQMKYPFYYFSVDTKGWESSVRHNLIGNDAFKKNEETHLWSRVPGIDIDAGKKRKAPSPEHGLGGHYMGHHYAPHMHHAAMYGPGQMAAQGYPPGQMLPEYQQHYAQPNAATHQPQQQQQQQYTPQPVAVAAATAAGAGAGTVAGAVGQQPSHPAYPIAAQTSTHSQAPAYGTPPATVPRPSQPLAQPPPYASQHTARPQATPGATPPGTTPHSLAKQSTQPNGGVQPPANGVSQAQVPAPHAASALPTAAPATAPAQPAQSTPPVVHAGPLKPAVSPELLKWVKNFRNTVTQQLQSRTPAAQAIALSVINRGLGLIAHSLAPAIVLLPPGKERDDEVKNVEKLEKVVLSVFEQGLSGQIGGGGGDKPMRLEPALVEALRAFMAQWVKTIEGRIGAVRSEALILSAIDRALGFVEHSVMQADEKSKKELATAEDMLLKNLQTKVLAGYRRSEPELATVPS